jgi:hypothetical protein
MVAPEAGLHVGQHGQIVGHKAGPARSRGVGHAGGVEADLGAAVHG